MPTPLHLSIKITGGTDADRDQLMDELGELAAMVFPASMTMSETEHGPDSSSLTLVETAADAFDADPGDSIEF